MTIDLDLTALEAAAKVACLVWASLVVLYLIHIVTK